MMYLSSSPKAIFDASQKQQQQYQALVVKSNTAIRKARYSLSVNQQTLLCYLIYRLQDSDTHETVITFDIKTFCDFIGKSDDNYTRIKADLETIANKSWWIQNDDGTEILMRFFNTVHTSKRSGKVYIKFHEDILPYLQGLKREFTPYKLWYTMTMRSEYSIRLYELLKSVSKKSSWVFEIDYLKKIFMCEHYQQFCHFRQRVLEPAVAEINAKTDINVSYEKFKEGRTYKSIEFYIEHKSDTDRLNVDRAIRAELDGQTSLFVE